MKRIHPIFFFAFFLLTAFACKKENNNPLSGGCELKYSIDGVEFTSNPDVCIFFDNTINLGLIGSNSIHLQIDEITEAGSVQIPNNFASIMVDLDNDTRLIMIEGVINVTSLNNSSSKGNFSGTMREITDFNMTGPTYSLTNGTYNATFSN